MEENYIVLNKWDIEALIGNSDEPIYYIVLPSERL